MDVNSRDPSQNIIPFRIKGVESARFDVNGNLGIGTITPTATLDVSGTTNIRGNVSIGGGASNYTNNDMNLTLNGHPIENKTAIVVSMDSQPVAATALNRQKKQSIPLAAASTLSTSDIVAKMSGVSVGKTQVYGVGPAQMATYGNIVVAVGSGTNSIAYSLANPPTAASWVGIPSSAATFTSRGLNITYANGTWVAVGEGTNVIAYSTMTPPVASSWVGIPTGTSINGVVNTFGTRVYDIAYGNGAWVAVGVGVGTNSIAYSLANPPTAESWVGIPLSFSPTVFNNDVAGITFGNGTWVATGYGNNGIAYSVRTPPTADSWIVIPRSLTNDNGNISTFSEGGLNITYANGVWLIAGQGTNSLCYSVENPPIAGSWMPITTGVLFGYIGSSIAYGNGTWVACGSSGTLFAYSTSRIPHSSSWVAMKGPTPSSSGEIINNISFNPATNTWYFLGDIGSNCMFYSTATPPVPATWIGVQRSAGTFTTQAFGAAGITTSAFTAPVNVARLDNKVTFPANRMIAVGGGGGGSGSAVLALSVNTPTPATTGTISYSDDDGATWQMVPGGATNAMFSSAADIAAGTTFGVGGSRGANAVAWNGEKWVAAGNGRTHSLAFSDDGGMTWTGITGKSIFSVEARDCAWNGQMWVAVGRGSLFSTAYSYDGITWVGPVSNDASGTPINVFSFDIGGSNAAMSDISGGGNHVIWTGKMWVATGTRTLIAGSSPPAFYTVAYSMDGKSWTGVAESGAPTTGFDIYAHGVAWNGRSFIATGRGTVNTLVTFTDVMATASAFSTDASALWQGLGNTVFSVWGRGITWGARRWMATGCGTNTVAYSTNGRTWQGCGANVFKPLRRFMAMGDTGLYTSVISGQTPQRGVAVSYSDDGITWDAPIVNQSVEFSAPLGGATDTTRSVIFANNNTLITNVITDNSASYLSLMYSTDAGASWARVPGTSDVAGNGGTGMTVANNGSYSLAMNTARTRFLVGGGDTASATRKVYFSNDGFNWYPSISSPNTTQMAWVWASLWVGGIYNRWLIGGSDATTNTTGRIMYSGDADAVAAWLAASPATYTGNIIGCFAANASFSVILAGTVSGTNTILRSENGGATWATVSISGTPIGSVRSIAFSPSLGRWVAVGGSDGAVNTIIYSNDATGSTWTAPPLQAKAAATAIFKNDSQVSRVIWDAVGGRFLVGGWNGQATTATLTNVFGLDATINNNPGNTMAYSADGINWTPVTVQTADSSTPGYTSGTIFGPFLTRCREIMALDMSGDFTPINTGYSVSWNSYANRFVATGNGTNPVVYSNDGGITWTPANQQPQQQAIVVAGGVGAAAGTTTAAHITYSIDGKTWSQGIGIKEIFGTGSIFAVRYGQTSTAISPNGRIWVAGGVSTSGTSCLAFSQNGIRWTAITGANTMITTVRTLAYAPAEQMIGVNNAMTTATSGVGNGVWVAGGDTTNSLIFSYDGISWSEVPNSLTLLTQCNACAFGNGLFVAGGTPGTASNVDICANMVYSTDGLNWQPIRGSRARIGSGNAAISSITYGQDETGRGIWVAGTNQPTAPTVSLMYSYNGIDWVGVANSGTNLSSNVTGLAYGISSRTGQGLWVASVYRASGYSLLFSTNGRDGWTAISNTRSGLFDAALTTGATGVAYLNGVWYATGLSTANTAGRSLAYSYDGSGGWFGVYPTSNMYGSLITTFSGTTMQCVATTRDYVIPCGGPGGSPSSLTPIRNIGWTAGIGSAYLQHPTLLFGRDNNRAGSTIGTAISSDGGRSWGSSTVSLAQSAFRGGLCYDAFWNGAIWVAVGYDAVSGAKVATSKDGITWRQIPAGNIPITGVLYSIMWNGNIWMVGGDGSPDTDAATASIAWSNDLITWNGISLTDTKSRIVRRIAWNGMYWVAVGEGDVSTIMHSRDPNGLIWEDTFLSSNSANKTAVITSVVNDIVWGGGRWVAVGRSSLSGTSGVSILYSTDTPASGGQPEEYAITGRRWTGVASSAQLFPYGANSVSWNGKRFVATGPASSGYSTGNIIAWSADGISWTAYSTVKTVAPGQRWVAVGSGSRACIALSADGRVWTDVSGSSLLFSDISGANTALVSTMKTGARSIGWNGNSLVVGGARAATTVSATSLLTATATTGRTTIPVCAFIGSGNGVMGGGTTNVPDASFQSLTMRTSSSVFITHMDVNIRDASAPWANMWLNTYTDLSGTQLFQITPETQTFSSALKWNGWSWVANFGMTTNNPHTGEQYGSIWYCTDPLARVGWSVASNSATPRILIGQGGYAALEWNGVAWLACGYDPNNNNMIYTTDRYGAVGWTAVSGIVSGAGSASFQPVCIASSSRFWVVGGSQGITSALYYTSDRTGATGWREISGGASVLPGIRITSIGYNGTAWVCCGGGGGGTGAPESRVSWCADTGSSDIATGWAAATISGTNGNIPSSMSRSSAIIYNTGAASPIWVLVGDASGSLTNQIAYTTTVSGSSEWKQGLGTTGLALYSKLNGIAWTGYSWIATSGAGSSRVASTTELNAATGWNSPTVIYTPTLCTNAIAYVNIPISLLTTGMSTSTGSGAGTGAMWRGGVGRAQGLLPGGGRETTSVIVRSANGAEGTRWSQVYSRNFLIAVGGGVIRDASGVGGTNRMAYSYDGGLSWTTNNSAVLTTAALNSIGSIRTVKYGNGMWVAGGDSAGSGGGGGGNCIAWSRDGVNWTGAGGTQVFGTAGACYAVCCNDRGRWVAVGGAALGTAGTYTNTSGAIYTMAWSDDGMNWTPILGSRALFGIVCQGVSYGTDASGVGMWMAIGRGVAYTGCAYSYDAKNWYLSQTSGSLFGASANVLTERYAPVASANWNSISLSSTGQYQTAVVYGGNIWTSSDYGVTWTEITTTGSTRNWNIVSLSSTGQYQSATVYGNGNIWTSSDYGFTWTSRATNFDWIWISISSTGQYQSAAVQWLNIWTSSDYGVTWTSRATQLRWSTLALSSTGQYQSAAVYDGEIWTSSDYGLNWLARATTKNWLCVSLSSTGQYQAAVATGNNIWTSTDYGLNWTERTTGATRNWNSISLSSTGQYQSAVANNGNIWTSSNYGVDWTSRATSLNWYSVSLSSTGQYQTALGYAGAIFISSNFGETWSSGATDSRSLGVAYGKDASGVGMWVVTAGRRDRDVSANLANTMAYSYDGKLWRGITASAGLSEQAWSVAYGKDGFGVGMWVCAGYDVTCGLKWSYDGVSWNATMGASGAAVWAGMAAGRRALSVYWNGSMWLASTSDTRNGEPRGTGIAANNASGVPGYLLYSYNGKNWLPVLAPNTYAATVSASAQPSVYSVLPNPVILDFGSFYDDQVQRGVTIANTTARTVGAVMSGGVPIENINTIVPYGRGSLTTGQVPFLLGGDSGLGNLIISTATTRKRWTFTKLQDGDGILNFYPIPANNNISLHFNIRSSTNRTVISYNINGLWGPLGGIIDNIFDIHNLPNPSIIYISFDIVNGWKIEYIVSGVAKVLTLENYLAITTINNINDTYFSDFGTKASITGPEIIGASTPHITSDLAASTTSLSTSVDGGITWRAVPNSTKVMTKVNKILCDETTQQIVAVGTGNYSVATSTLAKAADADGWTGVFGSRMTDTRAGLFEKYGTGASWFGGAKMWIASGRAQTRRGSSLAVSVNGTVWQDAKIVSQVAAGAAGVGAGRGGGLVSRTTGGAVTTMVSSPFTTVILTNPITTTITTNITRTTTPLTFNSSVIPYTAPATPLLTYTDSAAAFSTQVSSIATNSQYNRAVVGGSGVQFVAGGRGGITVSNDGQNWTAAAAGAATVFQTPTNVTTRTGGGGFDASFGTVALTQRLTTPATYPTGSWISISLSATGQYQSAVIGGSGNIYTSSDYGVSWTQRTQFTGSWYSISLSASGQYQSAVIISGSGNIYTSSDYGVSWTRRTQFTGEWLSISLSSTGQYQSAVIYSGSGNNIYTSSDYGVSWTQRTQFTGEWRSISLSSTGQYQSAVSRSGLSGAFIYTSSDYGVSWTRRTQFTGEWRSISLSSTGQYQSAVIYSGSGNNIYTSSDYGVSWTQRTQFTGNWISISLSSTGQYQSAVISGGHIYTSSDYGVSWTQRTQFTGEWLSISLSSTGQYQSAVIYSGGSGAFIYTSTDFGATWVQRSTATRTNAFTRIKSSASGQYQIATSGPVGNTNGQLYVSSDYGQSWIPRRGLGPWLGGAVSATGAVMMSFLTPSAATAVIIRSTDFGNTFTDVPGTTLALPAYWRAISVSNSAAIQTAVAYGGSIYRSLDTGATWSNTGITIDGNAGTNTATPRNWQDIAVSAETGAIQVTCVSGGYLYLSTNTGESWNSSAVSIDGAGTQTTNRVWQAVAVSADGQYGLACVNSTTAAGFLYRSVNTGATWTSSNIVIDGVGSQATNRSWQDVGMSANGKYQVACLNSNTQTVFTSNIASTVSVMVTPPGALTTTFGTTWTQRGADIDGEAVGDQSGYSVSLSADGTVVAIGAPINTGASGRESGQVRVYALNAGVWSQRGADIDGAAGMSSLPMVVTATTTSGSRIWWSVSLSSTGQYQTAVVRNSQIHTSSDFGVNWTPRHSSYNTSDWTAVSLSSTGQYQTAIVYGGQIHTSSNFGIDWTPRHSSYNTSNWYSVSLSSSGQYQTAVVVGGQIHTSSNFGIDWTPRYNTANWWSVSLSSSGQYQTAVVVGGQIHTSSNFGIDWTPRYSSLTWYSVSLSSTGQYQTAVVSGGQIHTSSDFGINWTPRHSSYNTATWWSVSVSSTGQYQTAVVDVGQIHTSSNFGIDWTPRYNSSTEWRSVSLSSTGQYQTVVVRSGQIHTSRNYGFNWSEYASYEITEGDRSGSSVSLSANGNTLAVGAPYYDLSGIINRGQVRVFDWSGSAWAVRGTNILLGEGSNDYSGMSVSLSEDGKVVAVGAPLNGGAAGTDSGHVRVYAWDGSAWAQRGADIDGGYGLTATNRVVTATTTSGSRDWRSVSLSSTGQYQTAVVGNGQIHTSSDFGINWTPRYYNLSWHAVSLSSTGQYQTAVVYGGQIHTSSNFGIDWTPRYSSLFWNLVSLSSTGQYQTAVVVGGQIHTSSDFGVFWTPRYNSLNWILVSVSTTGQYQTAVVSGGQIHTSSDFGINWTPRYNTSSWYSVSLSSTGQYQTAVVTGGQIHTSRDYGFNWSEYASYEITDGDQSGSSVSLSADGSVVAVGSPYTDTTTGINSGRVRVLAWSGSAWALRGSDILGEATNDQSGWSTSMSADGTTVAIGAPYNNGANGIGCGQVRVYKWSGSAWGAVGTVDIDGEAGALTPPRVVTATETSGSRNWYSVAMSATGQYQTAVVSSGSIIYTSSNYGVTWTPQTVTESSSWRSVSLSSTGQYQSAVGSSNFIRTSSDYGINWTSRTAPGAPDWRSVSLSATGQYQTAVPNGNLIQTSSDFGVTWITRTTPGSLAWWWVSLSSTGQYQTVVAYGANIYTSSDYGVNWTARTTPGSRQWYSVSLSSTGQYQTAVAFGGQIHTSSNFGIDWTPRYNVLFWSSVSLSSTGQYQTAIALESQIHTSSNFGIDWTQRYSVLNWLSVSVSSTGQYQTASASSSTIYFSRDYGFNWSEYASYEVVSGGDQSGYSLSLSADGNSLAVGAPYNDAGATGADRGHVRVYDYNGSTAWNQRGTTDIDGEASNDLAGWSVSLSADGSTVAFGAPMNDGSGNLLLNSGSVRVFNVATTNAITYTSSNSSVADICSNILIIKGVNGTSNIVATQGATTTNGVLTVNGALYTMVYTIGSLSTISYIYYSKDYGASWTSLTTAGSRSWSSIALSENGSTISATTIDASGGVWVYAMPDEQYYRAGAVANSGSTTTPSTVRAITYGNSGTGATTDGYWVAGADASANTLAYSSNGMDWTAVVGSKTTLFNAVNGVAYGADGAGTPLWVAVGAPFVGSVPGTTAFSIAYSYNMTTWVGVRNAANFTGQGNHVAYGQDEYGAGVWVAVGQSDGVLAANLGDSALYNSGGTPNTTIFYSYDGANWAAGTGAGVFAVSGTDIAWGVDASGVGTWVATGIGFTDPTTGAVIAGGQVAHSTNGRVWTPIRAPTSIVPAMSPATIPANERRNVIPAPPTSTGFAASLYTDIWRMLGGDIDGEAATDQSGWSVALSADGTTLAIGAPYANTNDTGHVRVYKYNPNKTAAPAGWEQLGADIDAETSGDNNGWRVALSADGTTLAIGTPYANADDKGRVRVYKYNPNKSTTPVGWEQLGADIDGEAGNDNSGYSVALSADGTTLAIGAIYSNTPAGGDDNVGHVRVYKYNPNKTTAQTNQSLVGFGPVGWDRLGADIDGEVANDYSGWSVALSADGTTVAIGAIGANSPAGTDNVGHVRVYKYNPNKTTAQTNQSLAGFGPAGWDRLGADIDGEAVNDNSGYSVALSADGTTLAIGAPYANTPTGTDNTGHVRVYKYNPNKTLEQTNQGLTGFGPVGWDRLGQDIDGEAQGDYSGYSVALSADGTTLAIGAYEASTPAGTNNTGHVRVYKYNPTKTTAPAGWDQLGVDIDGEAQDDLSGHSVALSADGTTLAIGARANDGAGLNNSGHVRVYKLITAQAPATFTISNPAIADIENGGFIVIKSGASGSATITAVQPASPPFTFAPVVVQGTLTVSGSVYTLVYDTFYPIFTPFPGAVAGNTITVAYGRAGSQGAGAPLWIVGGAGTTNVFARSSIPSAITTAGAWSVVANTAPTANAPFAVCNSIGYSNGVWVAGNNTDATNILARSTDGGTTWTPVSASSISGIIAGAAAVGANAFCNYSLAVADYSNDTNLRSWVAVQGTKNFFFEGGVSAVATVSPNIVAILYNSSGNNTRAWWVAGGVGLSGVASLGYTTDPSGATGWTKSASSDIANLSAVNAVAFSPHTQRWLAVGAGASISLGTNVLYSDASGATWTSSAVATALTPVITLNTCVWNQAPASASSAGSWLVGGTRSDISDNISTSASVYISTDVSGAASPWTPITGTGAILSQVYSLAYNGVVWIAAGVPATDTGSTSTLMQTTDPTGATGWQGIAATNTSTGGFDTAARSVSWNDDQQMWVATGENTGAAVDASFSSVIYSLDISGSSGTWRTVRESNSICFSDEGTGLAFTGDKWYAVGYGNNQIVATTGTAANAVGSSATASWTPVAHETALTRATDIAYTGRRLIATGAGSGATTGIIMSTDTTGSSWTSATTGFTDASGGGTSVAFEASYDGVGRVVATGKSATNTICVSVTDGGSTSWNTPTAPSTQFSSSNTFDTTTQSLFTTGGNSVAYVGNDTLFAVGGNDVHWTGKQWVAVGRNSTENPVAPVVSTPSSSAPPVEVVGNTTPVATSPDGIMWQCVRTSQAPNLSDGTFVATNSRIGATPLIDSRITIADGGDTEVVNMDYGGSGTGIAQIDIIAELTPVSHAASSVSSSGAVGVIGAAGNGGANSVGNASIPSFDTTSFLITTRPQ